MRTNPTVEGASFCESAHGLCIMQGMVYKPRARLNYVRDESSSEIKNNNKPHIIFYVSAVHILPQVTTREP